MRTRAETERVVRAVKTTLSPRGRVPSLVLLAIATFFLFIALPVWMTPGNDFLFQLQIMQLRDFVLFGVLAVANALLILMQWHVFQTSRTMRMGSIAASGTGSLSAVFASILSTASCSACIAGILGFLGTGSILFILDHRWWFALAAIVIVLVALVFAARRIDGVCTSCVVKKKI